jgi:hypothetical protein
MIGRYAATPHPNPLPQGERERAAIGEILWNSSMIGISEEDGRSQRVARMRAR